MVGNGAAAVGRRTPAQRRGSGAASVYDGLKREILELELAPGALLDETELSRRFGVSRSPVREALIRLAGERLVLALRNRSAVVAPFDLALVAAHVDATRLLYRATTRLAAQRRRPADLARLAGLAAAHDAAVRSGDVGATVGANAAFHTAIGEVGGNEHYLAWLSGLLDQGQRLMRLCIRQLGGAPDPFASGHRAILAAIEAGDADAAEAAGAADAAIFAEALASLIAQRPAPPSGAAP
jgi:DNA-binding GntR family transcriptional regulator